MLLGLFAFLWLSSHRTPPTPTLQPGRAVAEADAPDTPPPRDILLAEAQARGVSAPTTSAPRAPPPVASADPSPPATTGPDFLPSFVPPAAGGGPRTQAPTLIIDFGESATPGIGGAKPSSAAEGSRSGDSTQNADEQFVARAEAARVDRSRAVMLRNTGSTVAQGTVIPAILETALDSDLPGFTRAVVSRDVLSFDGRNVLVPRGSRVVGQYRNAQALGASRAFVIWTRILRSDGASIQIGSSGADELGRAGLAGRVDRHFLERFGGSILLSVVNAGLTAAAGAPSAQVVISSPQDANSVASSAASGASNNISPTIRVPQGTAIRIFVARDLDFSSVEPVQP